MWLAFAEDNGQLIASVNMGSMLMHIACSVTRSLKPSAISLSPALSHSRFGGTLPRSPATDGDHADGFNLRLVDGLATTMGRAGEKGADSIFLLVAWELWKEQNARCFRGANTQVPQLLATI